MFEEKHRVEQQSDSKKKAKLLAKFSAQNV